MDLVTGSTGIVGTHVLLELARAGRSVRALHRTGSDRSIVDRVFRHYGSEDLLRRIAWAEGDITDVSTLADAMRNVERVFHTAAMVTFDPRRRDAMYRVNVEGTANVVNAALDAGVKRLCHVSSIAALGHGTEGQLRDEQLAFVDDKHASDYARSKHLAEMEVQRGLAEGLNAVLVNPALIIGPGAAGRSSLTLVERVRHGTRWYTRGTNGFVDARDVAACMIALMEHEVRGERYVLVGANASYRELFTLLAEAFSGTIPSYEAKPWMLGLAWRAERLRSLLSGRSPLVTRATVASALAQRSFSNAKVIAATGHQFRTLAESVANVSAFVNSESTG